MARLKTRTINKNNWSGEDVTYKYSKNRVFVNGLVFRIVQHGNHPDILKVYWKYEDEEGLIAQEFITLYNIDKIWYAEQYGVSRESENLYDVIVEMAMNLI